MHNLSAVPVPAYFVIYLSSVSSSLSSPTRPENWRKKGKKKMIVLTVAGLSQSVFHWGIIYIFIYYICIVSVEKDKSKTYHCEKENIALYNMPFGNATFYQ